MKNLIRRIRLFFYTFFWDRYLHTEEEIYFLAVAPFDSDDINESDTRTMITERIQILTPKELIYILYSHCLFRVAYFFEDRTSLIAYHQQKDLNNV